MRKILALIGIIATSLVYSCGNSGKENQSSAETAIEQNDENEGAQSDEVTGANIDSISVGASEEDKQRVREKAENDDNKVGGFSGNAGAEDTSETK